MQARRAARELTLILFSQINSEKYDFQDIIIKSVRTLTNSSIEELNSVSKEILSIKGYISDYEANHPKNLERPIEVSDKPVPIPMTDDMQNKLDRLLDIAEKTMLALEIAEMAALEENAEVKKYISKIVTNFTANKNEIDDMIKKMAIGWDFKRLVRMDKDILRIAVCELLYIKEVPIKVIVDEAVELAKKYSTDDSSSFVNGILAKIILENNLK